MVGKKNGMGLFVLKNSDFFLGKMILITLANLRMISQIVLRKMGVRPHELIILITRKTRRVFKWNR